MSSPQVTWDTPGAGVSSAPAVKWDEEKEKGFLDREIPLRSYKDATLSGVQSIGRGLRSAVGGIGHMIAHPFDAADETVNALADFPDQVKQIPGAIHDINASADPTGTYLKAAQDTAGEGAGQALTALATEGIGKAAGAGVRALKPVASAAKPIIGKGLAAVSDVVDPDITGIVSPRAASLQRTAGRIGRAMTKPGVQEQAAGLGKIPVSAATDEATAEAPSIVRRPGEVAPEMIRPRAFAGRPAAPIPPREGLMLPPGPEPEAGSMVRSVEEEPARVPTPSETRSTDVSPKRLESLLNEGLGGKSPVTPGKPIASRPAPLGTFKSAMAEHGPIGEANPDLPKTGALGVFKREMIGKELPEGFTPVDSTAIKGYKYNPAARELEAITKTGQHYVHGDVSPEEFEKFEASDSKGTAWNNLRKAPGVTQVATVQEGARIPTKPGALKTSKGTIAKTKAGMNPDSAPLDDYTDILQRSIDQAPKKTRIAKATK